MGVSVREILRNTPLIDAHNDMAWQYYKRVKDHLARLDLEDTSALQPAMHTDLRRLRAGGVGGQFWSVFVPVTLQGANAVRATMEQIDVVRRLVARHPHALELAFTAADVRRVHRAGRIASLMGMEGGHSIGSSLAALRILYLAGARYMTLTHWKNTDWADAATDAPAHHGLTAFGREVVREMNRLGMLVDLSHVSDKTMDDALAVSAAPVIFSHSSSRALCAHPRNVPDRVLRKLAENGGMVMVNFSPEFVSEEAWRHEADKEAEKARLDVLMIGDPGGAKAALTAWEQAHPAPRATLSQVADHIEHVARVAGVDQVGLGSDFDGIDSTPVGLEDVSRYPALILELKRRGWTNADLRLLAGENVLRVLAQAEQVAARLQGERAASEVRMEDLQPGPEPASSEAHA